MAASKVARMFGGTIRRMRLERGWTQEDLADAAGLTATYIGFVERGVQVPSLTAFLKLARGFDVAPADLLTDFPPSVLRSLRL